MQKLKTKYFKQFLYNYGSLRKIDRQVNLLGKLGVGDIFGEISFIDAGAATATVVADEQDVKLYIIEGSVLSDLFEWQPHLSTRFYKYIATILQKRLRNRETLLTEPEKLETHGSKSSLHGGSLRSHSSHGSSGSLGRSSDRSILLSVFSEAPGSPEPSENSENVEHDNPIRTETPVIILLFLLLFYFFLFFFIIFMDFFIFLFFVFCN